MTDKTENLVWYAAYGSNLLDERFKYYLNGGYYAATDREYSGCRDKSKPRGDDFFIIPYLLYFAKKSPSWDCMGVAFIDENKKGETPARIRLITEEQLEDICYQESRSWYGNRLYLGEHRGYPVYTLTSPRRFADNAPSENYIAVINKGRRELDALCKKLGYGIGVGCIQ